VVERVVNNIRKKLLFKMLEQRFKMVVSRRKYYHIGSIVLHFRMVNLTTHMLFVLIIMTFDYSSHDKYLFITDVLALMGPSGTWFGCCAVLCCAFYHHYLVVSWLHLLGNVVSVVVNNKHTKHGCGDYIQFLLLQELERQQLSMS
jgi:hypothetical protein